ncbi:reverse transcriptase domain-containing protein, partial [Tanacetum coccineum]
MTNGRETTPPPGFLTPPHIPNINTTEILPITSTVFAAITLGNTSFAFRTSTSTDPAPMIIPISEVTPPLRTRSPRVRRQREKVVGFEEAPNKERGRIGRNIKGNEPLEARAEENRKREINPPTLGSPLGKERRWPTFAILLDLYLTGPVTPFVRWIKEYHLLDGLKMPSHVGCYDKKGDPDNFLHLLEGTIRMQKWLIHVACHMFTYTLKDSSRIWWSSQKAGCILNYEDLKAKFQSHFSQQKRFTKTHLAVYSIKQREGESVRAFATRYIDDTLQILGLHEDQRISGFVHGLKARNLVEHLSTNLPSTNKGLMENTYTWIKAREVATNELRKVEEILLGQGQGTEKQRQ